MKTSEIESEAKKIMDSFMEAMSDVEVELEYIMIRESCFREEGEGLDLDLDFKSIFLSNAPRVMGDSILANKGKWLE